MIDGGGTLKSALPLARAPVSAGRVVVGRSIATIVILLGTFVALWPSTAALTVRWADTVSRAYTHGSLILLLACVLLWRRRASAAALPAQPSWPAAAATAILGLLWLVMYRAGIEIGHLALLPLIVAGTIATVFGSAILRALWLPVAYLYFTIPLFDAINPLLQWASAFAVGGFLNVVGIPVYFDGLEFQIPAGRFEIADGCSGLHFFIVGLSIATLYGEWHFDTWRVRLRLLVLAAAMALLTNWVRICIIIVAGHVTDMQHHLVSEEHYTFGWFLFAGMMAIYFLIVRRWAAPEPAPVPAAPAAGARAAPVAGVVLACAALAVPAIAPLADDNTAPADRAAGFAPKDPPGWTRGPAPANAPVFRNADAASAAGYVRDGAAVQAFSAVYLAQSQGKEFSGFGNEPLGEGFRQASAFVPDGDWLEARATDAARDPWLVRIRYRIGHTAFTGLRRAQLEYSVRSIVDDPLSSVTVLRTRCAADDCASARPLLDRFTREMP